MPVTIGVDPHKASHTTAALDEHGHLLGQQRIPATLEGYQALRGWAARWPDRRWAVEGAHGIGRALAQRLGLLLCQAAAVAVVDGGWACLRCW
jgi:transposase